VAYGPTELQQVTLSQIDLPDGPREESADDTALVNKETPLVIRPRGNRYVLLAGDLDAVRRDAGQEGAAMCVVRIRPARDDGKRLVRETDRGILWTPCAASAELCTLLQTEAWPEIHTSGGGSSGVRAGETRPQAEVNAARRLTQATDTRRVATWGSVEMWFLDEHTVQILVNGQAWEPLNYAVLGFEDRRSGNPKRAWTILRGLAKHQGIIPTTASDRPKIEKRIQEIRRALRARFELAADPVPFNGTGYRAAFKIGVRPSFRA
jgi:hypothetical protein